jgi:hypothetical protein
VLEPRKRGRKADPAIADALRVSDLAKDSERLRRKLATAHTIIDVQKNSVPYSGCPWPRTRRKKPQSFDTKFMNAGVSESLTHSDAALLDNP